MRWAVSLSGYKSVWFTTYSTGTVCNGLDWLNTGTALCRRVLIPRRHVGYSTQEGRAFATIY